VSEALNMNAAKLIVKAVPGASRDQWMGRHGQGIKVRISAPPEKGKANAAVIGIVARELGVGAQQISIVRGQTSPTKVLQITGLDQAQLDEWLASQS
jgi:uncharacterized protein (TIGR00251 family)